MVGVSGSEGKGGGVRSAMLSLSHIPSSLPIICVSCWGYGGWGDHSIPTCNHIPLLGKRLFFVSCHC